MTRHEELMRRRWDDLIKSKRLIGGDLQCGNLYLGNITRIKNYYGRMTVHFDWAARRIRGGWSARALRRLTVDQGRLEELNEKEQSISFNGGNDKFYLKGHGALKQEHVMPQLRKGEQRQKKGVPLPLFDRST